MPNPYVFDYIVVGAGSSGCVVASRLSARKDVRVLLIEAGGMDSGIVEGLEGGPLNVSDLLGRPENVILATWNPVVSQAPETTVQVRLGDKKIAINRGVVRGGCSSVNGTIYVRGHDSNYDEWEKAGCTGWGSTAVLKFFKESENFWDGGLPYDPGDVGRHGEGGPLDVRPLPNPSPLAHAFIAGAAEQLFPGSRPAWDFNGLQQGGGAGLYQVNVTRSGQRASAAVAFLQGVATGRLTVSLNTVAMRIVFEGGNRAVGVECKVNGQVRTFRAEREIVLAGGAFGSPKLLMLSGIGPAADLTAKGIAVVRDRPGVGQNLHDHVMTLLFHSTQKDPGHSSFTAEAGLFVKVLAGSTAPDLQFHVLARMPVLPGPFGVLQLPADYFLICPTLILPKTRGSVKLNPTLNGADLVEGQLLIDPDYLAHADDIEVLKRGILLTNELTKTKSLEAFVKPASKPFGYPAFDPTPLELKLTEPEFTDFVRHTVTTTWHPAGTCKMGRVSDASAVVDPELRVLGIERLRVADASIMPTPISGNTNAACYMIGEKCAAMM